MDWSVRLSGRGSSCAALGEHVQSDPSANHDHAPLSPRKADAARLQSRYVLEVLELWTADICSKAYAQTDLSGPGPGPSQGAFGDSSLQLPMLQPGVPKGEDAQKAGLRPAGVKPEAQLF